MLYRIVGIKCVVRRDVRNGKAYGARSGLRDYGLASRDGLSSFSGNHHEGFVTVAVQNPDRDNQKMPIPRGPEFMPVHQAGLRWS